MKEQLFSGWNDERNVSRILEKKRKRNEVFFFREVTVSERLLFF